MKEEKGVKLWSDLLVSGPGTTNYIDTYTTRDSLRDSLRDKVRDKVRRELEVLLDFTKSEIDKVSNEIKDLAGEDIKIYRVHKEGEKVGLLKVRNEIQRKLNTK